MANRNTSSKFSVDDVALVRTSLGKIPFRA